MTREIYYSTNIITLIRACYGKFSSFRITKAGMQQLTELYQFVADSRMPARLSLM